MQVVELHQYPVKSLGGQCVQAFEVERWGPVRDRRWAVVDTDGRVQTARTLPLLLTLRAEADLDGIRLIAPGDVGSLCVRTPLEGVLTDVNVSRLPLATDAGDDAARFLSEATGREVRLVWQYDPRRRSVNPANGGLDGETLSLADAGPVLITSRRSLERLQDEVGERPVIAMDRFRPNVIVDGDEAFAEDFWSSVEIGDVEFRVQQRCDRCVMTNIDPATRSRGDEPMRTLRRHHEHDGKAMFGIRVVPQGSGMVRVGDSVSHPG